MPTSEQTMARISSSTRWSSAQVLLMSASPNSTTGSRKCSRWCSHSSGMIPRCGSCINPPKMARIPSTTSGMSISGDDSCGLTSPCAPCSSAWLSHLGGAEEGHDHLTGHVERGEEGGGVDQHVQRPALGAGEQQDLVLRPEAGERRDAGDGEPADDEGAARDRHQLGELAHLAHVLLVVHAVDDRARPEEQQRLEEGVRDHVEHGGHVGAGADGEEHEAELRHGGVREDAFDVGLRQRDRWRRRRRSARRPRRSSGRSSRWPP